MLIEDLRDGDSIYNMDLLIFDVSKRVATSGKEYLHFVFQDSTGNIEANKWEIVPDDVNKFKKGAIVKVTGEVLLYRTAYQIKIKSMELNRDSSALSSLLQQAPFSEDFLKKKLDVYLNSIKDEDIYTLTKALIDEYYSAYVSYPAATKNHHAYMRGLLHHSLTMADTALYLCSIYKSLNRDLLLAGALIHDLGKTQEFSSVSAPEYTLEGKLCGHISIGFAELRRIARELGYFDIDKPDLDVDKEEIKRLEVKKEKAIILGHMILSHHDLPEYGSPVRPLTREAYALSCIDDFDAKMQILDKAFKTVNPGDMTEKLFSMDDRRFYLPSFEESEKDPAGLDDLKIS